MIKYFCDECGVELGDSEHPDSNTDSLRARFIGKIDDWSFQVVPTYKGIGNAGMLCHKCFRKLLIDAVDAAPPAALEAVLAKENET